MRLFETPELEIVMLSVADVVTTSEQEWEPSFGMGNCA